MKSSQIWGRSSEQTNRWELNSPKTIQTTHFPEQSPPVEADRSYTSDKIDITEVLNPTALKYNVLQSAVWDLLDGEITLADLEKVIKDLEK